MKTKRQNKYNPTNIGRIDIAKLTDKQICEEYEECFQNITKSKQIVTEERNMGTY